MLKRKITRIWRKTLNVIYASILTWNREKNTLRREQKILNDKGKPRRPSSRPRRKTRTALHRRLPEGETRVRVFKEIFKSIRLLKISIGLYNLPDSGSR